MIPLIRLVCGFSPFHGRLRRLLSFALSRGLSLIHSDLFVYLQTVSFFNNLLSFGDSNTNSGFIENDKYERQRVGADPSRAIGINIPIKATNDDPVCLLTSRRTRSIGKLHALGLFLFATLPSLRNNGTACKGPFLRGKGASPSISPNYIV